MEISTIYTAFRNLSCRKWVTALKKTWTIQTFPLVLRARPSLPHPSASRAGGKPARRQRAVGGGTPPTHSSVSPPTSAPRSQALRCTHHSLPGLRITSKINMFANAFLTNLNQICQNYRTSQTLARFSRTLAKC